tara:strand:+ start:475 stop:834 length:360 start_codon:yes stop_codon:yes gene_type:complete
MSAPKYYKYTELESGFAFFERGRYLETTINAKYGNPQHLFEDLDTGERKCLNGAGQLNYFVDQMSEGDICKIVFKGKVLLESGKMAGKEANQFEVYAEDHVTMSNVDVQEEMTNSNELE